MSESSPADGLAAKVARSVLTRNLRLRPRERVTIEAWPHTVPWAVALARESRRMGAFPVIHYEDETAYWDSIDHGEARILGTPAKHEWAALANTDVYVHLWGPGDRVRLNALPPKKLGELFRFNEGWYATARRAGLRGARLELGRPYPTLARAYGADQETWTRQLAEATLVDPLALNRKAAAPTRRLSSGKRLHLTHPNGTDLTLGLSGRPARANTGRPRLGDPKRPYDILSTLPSGSVRVALDTSVAVGRLVGNRTCFYEAGTASEPVFEFSGGRLTRAEFGKGQELFDSPYRSGGKGRDRPGWFGIGLNPALHDTPQVEDVEAGAITVSVGGNGYLGGKNPSPFFGWAVIAGARLEVDGRPLALPKA